MRGLGDFVDKPLLTIGVGLAVAAYVMKCGGLKKAMRNLGL
jgi:hypothetical protein